MVVAHDHIDTVVFEPGDQLGIRSSAIDGNHQTDAVFDRPIDGAFGQTVSVFAPVGQKPVHLLEDAAEIVIHECRARNPVHVVVAVDHQRLIRAGRFFHHRHGLAHVVKREWVSRVGL